MPRSFSLCHKKNSLLGVRLLVVTQRYHYYFSSIKLLQFGMGPSFDEIHAINRTRLSKWYQANFPHVCNIFLCYTNSGSKNFGQVQETWNLCSCLRLPCLRICGKVMFSVVSVGSGGDHHEIGDMSPTIPLPYPMGTSQSPLLAFVVIWCIRNIMKWSIKWANGNCFVQTHLLFGEYF